MLMRILILSYVVLVRLVRSSSCNAFSFEAGLGRVLSGLCYCQLRLLL